MSNEASLINDSVCSGVTFLGDSAFYGKCYTEYDGKQLIKNNYCLYF